MASSLRINSELQQEVQWHPSLETGFRIMDSSAVVWDSHALLLHGESSCLGIHAQTMKIIINKTDTSLFHKFSTKDTCHKGPILLKRFKQKNCLKKSQRNKISYWILYFSCYILVRVIQYSTSWQQDKYFYSSWSFSDESSNSKYPQNP